MERVSRGDSWKPKTRKKRNGFISSHSHCFQLSAHGGGERLGRGINARQEEWCRLPCWWFIPQLLLQRWCEGGQKESVSLLLLVVVVVEEKGKREKIPINFSFTRSLNLLSTLAFLFTNHNSTTVI